MDVLAACRGAAISCCERVYKPWRLACSSHANVIFSMQTLSCGDPNSLTEARVTTSWVMSSLRAFLARPVMKAGTSLLIYQHFFSKIIRLKMKPAQFQRPTVSCSCVFAFYQTTKQGTAVTKKRLGYQSGVQMSGT